MRISRLVKLVSGLARPTSDGQKYGYLPVFAGASG
jgi:hypothetical protein